MKIRILMLSLIGLIFFNSCSNDSSSSDRNSNNSTSQNLDPNTILPKKVIIIGGGPGHFSCDFFYNKNKIDYIKVISLESSADFKDFKMIFTYTGDLITKIEKIEIQSGILLEKFNYTYQNNQLITKTITQLDIFNPESYGGGFY